MSNNNNNKMHSSEVLYNYIVSEIWLLESQSQQIVNDILLSVRA